MDEHRNEAFLVSGVRLDDTPVGPLYADCTEAHATARTSIGGIGGTARILRSSDGGWVEVARYTDTGMHSSGRSMGLGSWAATAADDDEPDWGAVVEVRQA